MSFRWYNPRMVRPWRPAVLAVLLAGPADAIMALDWNGVDLLGQATRLMSAPSAHAPEVGPAAPLTFPADPGPGTGQAEVGLECRPEVIESFREAWRRAGYGWAEREAALRIDRRGDGIEVVPAPMTWDHRRTQVPILRGVTIAIAHTHPASADPKPSPQDLLSPVPNYVISRGALYVTDPLSRAYRKVREAWDRPCGAPRPGR